MDNLKLISFEVTDKNGAQLFLGYNFSNEHYFFRMGESNLPRTIIIADLFYQYCTKWGVPEAVIQCIAALVDQHYREKYNYD